MGRAMIIICAGVLVSIGYVGFGSSQQIKEVVGSNASYAEIQRAKNSAYTVIQMAMREMDLDEDWRGNHNSESKAWEKTVDDSKVELWVEEIYNASNEFDADTIRVHSTAYYQNPVSEEERSTKIVNTYLTSAVEEYVPDFKGALTFATNHVNATTNGSASISGNSDTCEENKPAVSVPTDNTRSKVKDALDGIEVEGDVKTDPKLDYEPTDEMIARLKDSGNYTTITDNYKGDMGTKDDPGVFFVEDGDAKLTGGIEDGYGILVIRSEGAMAYEDEEGNELDIAGNFTFNGLVVFENAYNFDGKGTPTINGSVLVGHTEEEWNKCLETKTESECEIDVDLNGNIHLQYDCEGENYAKEAAANAIAYRKYVRTSTFE